MSFSSTVNATDEMSIMIPNATGYTHIIFIGNVTVLTSLKFSVMGFDYGQPFLRSIDYQWGCKNML